MINQEFIESIRLEGEEWNYSPLSGYNYAVSTLGRVASLPRTTNRKNGRRLTIYGSIMTPRVGKDGYLYLNLRVGGRYKHFPVHRLVASAFIPNPCGRKEIDHIDTNKTNNRVLNLRWCTTSENRLNPITLKRAIENTPLREQVPVIAIRNGVTELVFDSISDASRAGYNRNGIRRCLYRGQSEYMGYQWKIKPLENLVSMSKNSSTPSND